jgi:ribosome biogenesis protein ERB1
MAVPDALRKPTKRKQVDEEDVSPENLQATGSLEMLSDEEDAGDTSSDDGQIDEFPEIVDESESGESDFEEDDDDDESQEDDERDDEGAESDDSLHIFPKAKVVVSEITRQPKTVYPEIEPDYDSDSSTEEVSSP